MAHLHDIVFDCEHPASLARFWAAVLDGYAVAPYDDAELDRLRALGITDIEDDPTVLVHGPTLPRYFFQQVSETKAVKNRVHLDLSATDPASEVRRLVSLGATVLHRQDAGEHRWVTLADPEGNELCVRG